MRIPLIFCFLFSFHSLLAQESATLDDSIYIYRSLKEASAHPEKVFRLHLNKAKLDSFPAEILAFTNLTDLDLSKNRMEEIPAGIGNLVNLKSLNLANNKLVHLPPEIGRLKKLEFLGLNRNVLEDLPSTIGGLQSLEVFELWDNELQDVPDEISELGNLRVLEMRGILFTPEQLQRIDSLVVKSAKVLMSPGCDCKN